MGRSKYNFKKLKDVHFIDSLVNKIQGNVLLWYLTIIPHTLQLMYNMYCLTTF